MFISNSNKATQHYLFFYKKLEHEGGKSSQKPAETLAVDPEHCQNMSDYLHKNVIVKLADNIFINH